ncbi:pyridoxamine 5'-phosphate oxidase family protein [Paenibacillus gansuensis]|uniref:Pyridoxamine 5'-phosphate oxidase family protein n=1 Tax=Paenibacillus gansuensis TaxID=306542 RepID=A0ABW5PHL6_9BACL
MGKFFDELNETHIQFIQQQNMYFTATAPTAGGMVNVSPKGYDDSFCIIGPKEVAFVDYGGSGNETALHVQQNGRITLMWCSFGESPLILRIYGRGRVVANDSEEFKPWLERHFPGADPRVLRQGFAIDVASVQTSCGFGVPFMEFTGDRSRLKEYVNKKAGLA